VPVPALSARPSAQVIPALQAPTLGKADTFTGKALPLGSVPTLGTVIHRLAHAVTSGTAPVIAARILIVAILGLPGTDTHSTGILQGARVIVITRGFIEHELATELGVAGIVGARVAVVASQFHSSRAFTQLAEVGEGADVSVIAGGLVEGEDAALGRVAGVIGANISIGAHRRPCEHAGTFFAMVPIGARIAIVAERIIDGMVTTDTSYAGVIRADIAVVAIGSFTGQAPVHRVAGLDAVARVLVVTCKR